MRSVGAGAVFIFNTDGVLVNSVNLSSDPILVGLSRV